MARSKDQKSKNNIDKMVILVDKIMEAKFQELASEIGDVLFIFENKVNASVIDELAKDMDQEYKYMVDSFKNNLTKLISVDRL